MCHLLGSVCDQLKRDRDANRSQVYRASVLVKVYAEYNVLKSFPEKVAQEPEMAECLRVVYQVYAQHALEKHLICFYESGFARGPQLVSDVRNALLTNCDLMRKYSVTIADALAPPDFFLNSVIARADGRLYENLQKEFMKRPEALERPSWWQEVLPIRKSKL